MSQAWRDSELAVANARLLRAERSRRVDAHNEVVRRLDALSPPPADFASALRMVANELAWELLTTQRMLDTVTLEETLLSITLRRELLASAEPKAVQS